MRDHYVIWALVLIVCVLVKLTHEVGVCTGIKVWPSHHIFVEVYHCTIKDNLRYVRKKKEVVFIAEKVTGYLWRVWTPPIHYTPIHICTQFGKKNDLCCHCTIEMIQQRYRFRWRVDRLFVYKWRESKTIVVQSMTRPGLDDLVTEHWATVNNKDAQVRSGKKENAHEGKR